MSRTATLPVERAHGGEIHYIDLVWLGTPRNGECLIDRWWSFKPDLGVIIHKRGKLWSPQCNSVKQIADQITEKLYPGATTVLVPAAYLGNRYARDLL